MGMFKAIRQRMRDATAQTAEFKQSARSIARTEALARLIERHDQGLIGDEEFWERRAYFEQ
jgi:hypothetical protein